MTMSRGATFRYMLHSALLATLLLVPFARVLAADDTPKAASPEGAQSLDVGALKDKYWAKGNERELEVVQNRIYTKAHKVTLEVDGSMVGGDPFQDSFGYGGLIGFYFNETFGIDALYWKLSSSHSAAFNAFNTATQGIGVNTNPLATLMGGELTISFLYGKLSLIGKAIIHFDLMLRLGAGELSLTGTQPAQTQTLIAPWAGLGPHLYLSRRFCLNFDWRMIVYRQNVVEQYNSVDLNAITGQSTVLASTITAGLSVLLF